MSGADDSAPQRAVRLVEIQIEPDDTVRSVYIRCVQATVAAGRLCTIETYGRITGPEGRFNVHLHVCVTPESDEGESGPHKVH